MKKTFKIIMLPTEKDGVIWKFDASDKLIIAQGTMVSDFPFKKYDLYIISDEEKQDCDWCIDIKAQNTGQYNSKIFKAFKYDIENTKKIVATTDKGLGLPQIHKSFVDIYVNSNNDGKTITKVDLEGDIRFGVNGNDPNEKRYEYFKLKTNEDNTVIVCPTKTTYTKDEVIALVLDYREYAWKNGVTLMDCNKWIEKHV